jgi:predicted ATPase/DNA-binding winged helix-turn-helix (wHTH) protein
VSVASVSISVFGPYRLNSAERYLERDGGAVVLGSRALDILITLLERPGDVLSRQELTARAWPGLVVEEGTLRVSIAGLRRALGDGIDGARYIVTVPGRGYCFVAPVARSGDQVIGNAAVATHSPRASFLPARLMRMVGRSDAVRVLAALLVTSRFVSIVGPGGVGKTTVAVAVAHDLLDAFAGAVVFVDFGALTNPSMVPGTFASILGVSMQSDDPIRSLAAHLHDKRMLVMLDNCEHVIDAAAHLAEIIFAAAPQLHILATSREALRVEGEQVHQLGSLGVPPEDPGLTVPIALTHPAIQLFVERVAASGVRLDLTDADAVTVARICRRLDGLALAIELAAGRVKANGLQQTASLLDQHLTLRWVGQRTAPPRQQTLQDTLDWSYGLLSDVERTVFRRLAVFVGQFNLEAALAVVTDATVSDALAIGAIDSLVAKSLVATRPFGATMHYRLLDTTRVYALTIKIEDSELAALAVRHATHYWRWLERTGPEWATLSNAAERAPYLASLGDVSAALEWCFGVTGDVELGVRLAAAAAPVLLATSLLIECHRWSERSLIVLTDATRAGPEEMRLQAAQGLSLMFIKGNSDHVRVALARGLELAEQFGDLHYQLQMLGGLHLFHERIGEFTKSLTFAKRSAVVARSIGDPVAIGAAHSWLGISHHLMGNLEAAHTHLEKALASPRVSQRFSTIQIGFDYQNRAHITLARNLWLRGYPDHAARVARETVEEAAGLDHPVTFCMALIWAVTVSVWRRDLRSVEEYIDRFIAEADRYSLAPYQAAGLGVKGELSIRRGDVMSGIDLLRSSLDILNADRYELLTTELVSALAEGFALTGQSENALATIEQAIEQAEQYGRRFILPELLRIQGRVLATLPRWDRRATEVCLMRSLELSRHQAARGWELRTAIDLAALWASEGRSFDARYLLKSVFAQFTEGANTADLKAAEHLLASLI